LLDLAALGTVVRRRLKQVMGDLANLAGEPGRRALIVLGCGTTTLGSALALWARVEAFGDMDGHPGRASMT
jgi:hypothetical protein